jgi:allantoate deiminase
MSEMIDAGIVEEHVMALARHGAVGKTGVWRTVYSPEWSAAQDHVARWCTETGLEVTRDAVGTVWGRLVGTEGGPSIVTGSHVDSQTPGGRYDGALGVVAAVLAVRALKQRYGRPRRTIEVVSLCEEEGSRFQARFWGSRAIIGGIAPQEPDALLDENGISIAEAMRSVGLDPARIPGAARTDIDSFLELHIEQGPILEDAGVPVGVVRAITGIRHTSVELGGRSDHAGARPMSSRLDPVAGAAEVISGAIDDALRMGPPAVTTVGKIAVEPNLTAAVPDRVTFTIDARHPDAEPLTLLQQRHQTLLRSVAERRGLKLNTRIMLDIPPCVCDPQLVGLLEVTARELGIPFMRMHSGAAHDSQLVAGRSKVAMIFVRSIGGRSHTPAEFTTPDDAAQGIQVLASTLHKLAY